MIAILIFSFLASSGSYVQLQTVKQPVCVSPTTQNSQGGNSTCELDHERRATIQQKVVDAFESLQRPCSCGGPGLTRVVYLNKSDISQQCPPTLLLHSTPVCGCGRRSGGSLMCDFVNYPVGLTYSRVCG